MRLEVHTFYIEAEECFRTLARDAEEVVLGMATTNSLK